MDILLIKGRGPPTVYNKNFVIITVEVHKEKEKRSFFVRHQMMTIVSRSVTLIKRWWRLLFILLTPIILLPLPLLVRTIVSTQ